MREVLGPKHPNTVSSVDNLAILLHHQGKLAEAEPLYREALTAKHTVLGPWHPDTTKSLNKLANLLRTRGKLAEAEEVVAIRQQVLGPEEVVEIQDEAQNDTAGADSTQAGAAAAAAGEQQQLTLALCEETFRQQLSACSTGMVLLSGAWLRSLPQEERQRCGDMLATQGYMQLAETEDSLLLCSPRGVESLHTALKDAELHAQGFSHRGNETSSSSRVVDDDERQQQSQGSRWSWSSWFASSDGSSGAGGQRGQDPGDQGGAGDRHGASGSGSGSQSGQQEQGQSSPASALPADKCVQLCMSSNAWPDSDLEAACRPTTAFTSSTTGDMMVDFCSANSVVQLGVQMHMEACLKDGEQGTKLGFKIPRVKASAKAPPAGTGDNQLYFMHKVKLSLEVQRPNGIRINDTEGINQKTDLHTGTVTTVIMYKFKEVTVSTNITVSASPSGQLGVSAAFKEAPIAPVSGSQLPLVTLNPAQREIEANFGHGSKPCSFEIIRQPIYSMLCGDDADLGAFNSNPFNRRDEKELCFVVQEVDREWLADDGLHVKLALLALGARIGDDAEVAASKIVRDVKHVEYFHMWAGAIIKLGGPLEPVKTKAGCRVHTG